MKINDLKFDKRNYRKHNDKNLALIKKSVNDVGLARSIVIDNENEIICGNGLVSQLSKNTPVKVIETDGSELVVVKRIDLKTDDDKRKHLAVLDNSTSDSSDFDMTLLQEDFDVETLNDLGIEIEIENPEIEEVEEYEVPLWASDRKQVTVIDFNKPSRSGEHPTMKPVGLFDYQIKNNTKGGDIVLDLFGGSGTTIIACEQNKRIGYSMELDPKYCDVIIQRWENLTGKKAELLI